MIVTPVWRSPAMIARWTGAAPRYVGSSDACTLIMPRRGVASTGSVRIRPYAATTPRSARSAASSARNGSCFSRSGCSTGTPPSIARAFTGASLVFWPRPRGRSGCVTTPTTACADCSSASSEGTANAGVPKKTIRERGHHLPARDILRILRTIRSRFSRAADRRTACRRGDPFRAETPARVARRPRAAVPATRGRGRRGRRARDASRWR